MHSSVQKEDLSFLRAKNYAYRLLSYRQRSIREIADRLKKKRFSPKVIKKTVGYLTELDYLNDENFARAWVQTKLQAQPLGWSLLRYQLRQKGVAEEIIEKVLGAFAERYNEDELAGKLVAGRRSCYKGLAPLKLKKRLYDYLRRRGFPQEVILKVIAQKTDDRKQMR